MVGGRVASPRSASPVTLAETRARVVIPAASRWWGSRRTSPAGSTTRSSSALGGARSATTRPSRRASVRSAIRLAARTPLAKTPRATRVPNPSRGNVAVTSWSIRAYSPGLASVRSTVARAARRSAGSCRRARSIAASRDRTASVTMPTSIAADAATPHATNTAFTGWPRNRATTNAATAPTDRA